MQINIISIGKNMPSWVKEPFLEYKKRLSKTYNLKLIEITTPKRNQNSNIDKIKTLEAKLILEKIPTQGLLIALDEHGKGWETLELANKLKVWQTTQQNITFLIGGPDGLDKTLLKKADFIWSLSKLTLPHMLVRIVLIEQLYRAFTITIGHPYHRV